MRMGGGGEMMGMGVCCEVGVKFFFKIGILVLSGITSKEGENISISLSFF